MPNLYKRGETWWARFKVRGVEYRRSLRTAVRTEAERRLKAVRKDIEDEALFGLAPPKSWQEAVLAWKVHATADLSDKTVTRYMASLKAVRRFVDGVELRKVDIAKLREIVKGRRTEGASTATIRRDLTAMSSVIDHAIGEGWAEENPTLTIRHKRMKEKRSPIALPDDADIATVMAGAPSRFADAMEFARETGMRQDEIFGLTYRQLSAHSISITKAKHNRMRVIPYTRKAKAIVKRQPQFIGSQFVFHHSDGQRWASPASRFGDIVRRVAQKAAHGFQAFRFHDLRHLYAVEYLKAGKGSLYDLQQLLGHESVKTTEIYLKYLTPEQKKAATHGGTKSGTEAVVRN